MLSDLPDVEARIAKAIAVFGALRHALFGSRHITTETRVKVFNTFIMAMVLYGCESWSVTAVMARRLRSFQAQCARQILGVSMKKTISKHITTASLLRRLGLQDVMYYVRVRQLQYLGKVMRMPPHRLQRNPRRPGRPMKNAA